MFEKKLDEISFDEPVVNEFANEDLAAETVEPVVNEFANEDLAAETVETVEPVVNHTSEDINNDNYTLRDCDYLNVREDPSLESEIIHVLSKNDVVTINDVIINDFVEVTVSMDDQSNKVGYCLAKFLRKV